MAEVIVPGTDVVAFLSRGGPYFKDIHSDSRGFQFERHVQNLPLTYGKKEPLPNISMHIQLVRICDTYNAIMCSQVDATDPSGSSPVEVKTHLTLTHPVDHTRAALPGRQKALWQLIASGSPYLLAGEISLSIEFPWRS